jgi:LmbE family N-acetylglucosaminyl deacetylase
VVTGCRASGSSRRPQRPEATTGGAPGRTFPWGVNPTAPPALVLSPHPDDAVLGCWSALEGVNRRAVVVNLFAGIPPAGTSTGWDRACGVPDGAEMMRRRRAEDERALAVAGATVVNLDWLDRQYDDEIRDINRIAAAVRLAAPEALSALYAPAAIGGYAPLAGTEMILAAHPDHETTRQVALRLDRPDVPTYFFGELPYGLGARHGRTWPAVLEDSTPELEAATGRRLELVVGELSEAALDRRVRALELYGTQLSRLEEGVGQSLREPAILRYEVLWRSPSPGTARGSRRPMRRR